MIALIEEVRRDLDSIGGICELVAVGVPAGLGEPVFDKLKADLAKALLSLPAVTGFEYGAGFAVATMRGSENNDIFIPLTPNPSPRSTGVPPVEAATGGTPVLRSGGEGGRPRRIGTATNRHG